MTREDIIKLAREAGLAYGSDEKPLGSVTRFAALVAAAEREKVAAWMMQRGYATGHGGTIEDLLQELDWQIREREREACAVIAETPISGEQDDITMEAKDRAAAAIRARSEK
jgi:hypothetical protein